MNKISKLLITLNVMFVSIYPTFAQVKCETVTVWEVRLEGGKQIRNKSTINKLCKDAKNRVVESMEFGQGRELYYNQYEFDKEGRVQKEHYRHGFEGNDGGEGTITYQYLVGNKIIINYVATNFIQKTEALETKNAKKQVIKRVENTTSKSEVLPDYNYKRKTTITYEYAPNDSLSKQVRTAENTTTTESYQYKDRLRVRYENKHTEGTKIINQYIITYKYDSLNRLTEERTFEMPNYLTRSLRTISYKGDKIVEEQKTGYANFAEKKISYQNTKQFSFDEKGELLKESYSYFYGGQDKTTDETEYTIQGETKILTTIQYKNTEKVKKTKQVQTYKQGKIRKEEVYEGEKLDYILEYEYEN